MKTDELRATGSFGAHLKALRDAAGFTQEELATIAGLSVHAISALERGERRRPHVETSGPCRRRWISTVRRGLRSLRSPEYLPGAPPSTTSDVSLPLPPQVSSGGMPT